MFDWTGDCACKYGFDDMYDDFEYALRKAIDDGDPFDTGWVGSAKELMSFHLCYDGDRLQIETHAEMDDVDDLISLDCEQGYKLNEKQYKAVRRIWDQNDEWATETNNIRIIELTTYEDILGNLVEMAGEDDNVLSDVFNQLNETINWVLENNYMEEE